VDREFSIYLDSKMATGSGLRSCSELAEEFLRSMKLAAARCGIFGEGE